MKYAIEYRRNLNDDEHRILHSILSIEKSSLFESIDKLKVVGRCGCGQCPTVLFGYNFEDKFIINQNLLFDYIGKTSENELVGILIFGNENIVSELEFYSTDGQLDSIKYPEINSLEKIKVDY